MLSPNKLLFLNRNRLLHLVGGLAYAVSQWLMLMLAARYVSVEAVGGYVFYLAIFVPASILSNMGLRNSVASDAGLMFDIKDYFFAKVVGMVGFLVFGLCVIFWLDKYVYFGLVVLSTKLVDSASDLIYGDWVRRNIAYKVGVSQLIRLILVLSFIVLMFVFKVDSIYFLLSLPISMFIVFLFYDSVGVRDVLKADGARESSVFDLIAKSAPLAVGAILVAVSAGVPRVFLEKIMGAESLAVYALLMYFATVLLIPVTSLCQVSIPMLSRGGEEVEVRFVRKMAIALGAYAVFSAIFIFLMGPLLLDVLYNVNSGYSRFDLFLVSIVLLLQIFVVLGNSVKISARRFSDLFYSAMVGLFVLLLLAYFAIERYGLVGGFVSYICSLFSSLLYIWFFSRLRRSWPSL